VRDITEEKKAGEITANAAKEWSATFDSMSEGVSIHSADNDILNVNAALCKMLGKDKSELIGKKCCRIFHGKDAPIPGCPMEASIETGDQARVEVFEPAINRWLSISVSPVRDENGKITKFIHVVSDITDRKAVEEKVAEAMEAKSAFLSMVSHELRTPMTAIKEGIGIVLDGSAGAVNEEQKDFLDTAKRNVDRLSRLINDVLDYQRLEAGKTTFAMKRGSIAALIDDVVKVMLPIAKARNLALERSAPPDLPDMIFDPDKLTQVMINLINNAVKFTDAGSVTVRVSREGDSAGVSVEDTGVGIKKEDLPKLFQDFSQLDEGRARKKGSTGLGLAISKKIIEGHGGRIWVESEPGKGSRFKFRIPVKTRFRALVIDDDKAVLDVCRKALEKDGYEVACAESGLKGMDMIRQDRPDILLLDMKLPDVNGYEIIGRLRSGKATFMIPILVMSGYPEELAKLEDKREDSALSSIAKPFKLEEMVAMVRGMLRQG